MSEEMNMVMNKLEEMSSAMNKLEEMESAINRLEKKSDALNARMDSLEGKMDARFEEVDKRFEKIDKRFEEVDARFEKMDKRFEKMDARFEGLESALHQDTNAILEYVDERAGELEKKISDFHTEMSAEITRLDNKYDVLLHEQGSFKTGLELAIKNSRRIDALEKKEKKHIQVL